MSKIGILGAGSWGTALAIQFARNGHDVVLWARQPALAEEMAASRRNETYLPDLAEAVLPPNLRITHHLEDLTGCEPVVVVVPSHGFREVLRRFLALCPPDQPRTLISATKGIETETTARMSQVCFEEATKVDHQVRFAVLSGPTFAVDLVRGLPSLAVVASQEPDDAMEMQELLSGGNLRLYSSTDVVGLELGGTAKNVIAIAAGVVAGADLGHNALAALITRGLHEITRLGVAYGSQERTFAGLGGLGDLVLTCTGGLSRNRRVGLELAQGKTLEEIQSGTSMVAEGVRNALSISRLAKRKDVEMPITEQMVAVLYEGRSPKAALQELMSRRLRSEAAL